MDDILDCKIDISVEKSVKKFLKLFNSVDKDKITAISIEVKAVYDEEEYVVHFLDKNLREVTVLDNDDIDDIDDSYDILAEIGGIEGIIIDENSKLRDISEALLWAADEDKEEEIIKKLGDSLISFEKDGDYEKIIKTEFKDVVGNSDGIIFKATNIKYSPMPT